MQIYLHVLICGECIDQFKVSGDMIVILVGNFISKRSHFWFGCNHDTQYRALTNNQTLHNRQLRSSFSPIRPWFLADYLIFFPVDISYSEQ